MNRLIVRSLVTVSLLGVLLCLPRIASADGTDPVVVWKLTGVTFDDGGLASGSFDYNATTGAYSNIDIVTTTGSVLTGTTYLTLSNFGTSTPTGLLVGPPVSSTFPIFEILFNSSLTNAGGTVFLDTLDSIEALCTSSDCSTGSSRAIVSAGELVGTPSVVTPEPPAILLLGMGLVALLVGSAIRKVS